MRCVVRIPWMYTILALAEAPGGRDDLEREGLEIEEGAWVEVPPDVADWPTDYDRLAERTLGRCRAEPRHYKLFRHPDEADRAGFDSTGMVFGGVYTPAMWRRFAEALPEIKAFHEIPDDDPPGAYEEALRYLREAR
jgi:hypothetical protein